MAQVGGEHERVHPLSRMGGGGSRNFLKYGYLCVRFKCILGAFLARMSAVLG